MTEITITQTQKNVTPIVIRALSEMQLSGGGILHFEKGEYHFFKDGTEKRFFAVSNNSASDKHIVFPILNMENITVDGHGSTFIFHEIVFPFMISNSNNITLRNIIIDIGTSPLVNFHLHDFSDEGFYMDIDRDKSPFYVEDKSIVFKRENRLWFGKEHILSLHAIGRHKVQFLTMGEKEVDPSALPASLVKCDIEETPFGVYAKYRSNSPSHCIFKNETVSAIIDGGRDVDAICIDRSSEINIINITVSRAIGMGIIGQLSNNIRIDSFSTDVSYHKGHQTLTADSLHFVNCDGALEIKNCYISDTMDDAINVHGMYTVVSNIEHGVLNAKIMHKEQCFFNPYREADRLEIIDNITLEKKAEFLVSSAFFEEKSGSDLILTGTFLCGAENIKEGFLIENPDRMPNLHLHHNTFLNFPHNRISGAGNMIIEENHFSNCHAALLCLDLAQFWYESGRVKHLIYRNNYLNNCDIRGKDAFIKIGIDGFSADQSPLIHQKIEITGNHFSQISNKAIIAAGVQELIIKDNCFDCDDDMELFEISSAQSAVKSNF